MNIAKKLDSLWNWLVLSSANSNQVSLTVKGALATGISFFIGIAGATHLHIPGVEMNLNLLADQVVLFVQYGLGLVGVISTIVGLVRKIVLTFLQTTP